MTTKSRLARMRRSFFDVRFVSFIASYVVKVHGSMPGTDSVLMLMWYITHNAECWFARDLLLVSFY